MAFCYITLSRLIKAPTLRLRTRGSVRTDTAQALRRCSSTEEMLSPFLIPTASSLQVQPQFLGDSFLEYGAESEPASGDQKGGG